eukprot:2667654-Ditylum_brightwellii.AAC.1
MEQCCLKALMIVMIVLTSTSHVSHKGAGNGVQDSVDNGVDNGNDGADKHLIYISQGVDGPLTWRSIQNKHVVVNKDNDVDEN